MALLSLNNVEVVYDRVFLAVKGVSIEVPEAGLVALLGANGAGNMCWKGGACSATLRPPKIFWPPPPCIGTEPGSMH